MENQEHFGRLTDRMATFREEVLEEKPYIDAERAGRAKERAKEKLAQGGLSDREYKIVEAKLQRALVRLSVKS